MTSTATVIANLQAEVTRLENLLALDIHTCGPNCTRSTCVNRRLQEENDALKKELAEVNYILEGLRK